MRQRRISKFRDITDEAEAKLKHGNCEAAAQLFKQAIGIEFVPDLDSWEEYYDAYIGLSTALKDAKQFVKGRANLEDAIRQLEHKNIGDRIPTKRKVMKLKETAIHNLAKLEFAFSNEFKAAQLYQSYRKSMNQSFKRFKQALAIIIEMLSKFMEQDQEINDWWGEEYIKIKSNYLDLIFQEGLQFNDRTCFETVLADVERAKRFIKHCHTQKGEVNLYLCYYQKAITLRMLGRHQESYKLLLEDYQFEKSHNQQADADKTRKELLRYCLNNNLITEAKKYAITKEQIQIISYIQERRENLKKHFSQNPDTLRQYTKQFYAEYFEEVDKQQNQYTYDYRILDKYLEQSLQIYKGNYSVRGLFYYYLAQCNYRLQNYTKADRMISEALKLPNNDEVERRDWQIQQLMIRVRIPSLKQSISQKYNDMMKEINTKLKFMKNQQASTWLQTQKTHLLNVYQEFSKYQKKAKDPIVYCFATDKEDRMLNQLQKSKDKQKQPVNQRGSNAQKYDHGSSSQQNFAFPQEINQPQRQRRQIFNPEGQYARRCEELGIPLREQIKQALSKGNLNFNPFPHYYNMSAEELQQILPLLKTDNLDLRNHAVNDKVLDSIVNHAFVKCLKLNGVNNLSNQAILKAIGKMSSLVYLSFNNFSALKHRPFFLLGKNQLKEQQQPSQEEPRSLIHALLLVKYTPSQFDTNSLRVLKLKYCNLFDEHLAELDFELFPNLEEISLNHNLLQGKNLSLIMVLRRISKVNMSDNPLRTLNLQGWKYRLLDGGFILRKLKLRQITFSFQLCNELSIALGCMKAIDLSGSNGIGMLIDAAWDHYLQGQISLNALQEWIMGNVDLNSLKIQQLIGLLGGCASLQRVDLRFCKHSYNLREAINSLQGAHQINAILSTDDINPQMNTFDLTNDRQYM